MPKNRRYTRKLISINNISTLRKYSPEDAFELMDLETCIDIIHDLNRLTNDLNSWYQQYKYVERFAECPNLPRFKATFVGILTKLCMYQADYKMIEKYFKDALNEHYAEDDQQQQQQLIS